MAIPLDGELVVGGAVEVGEVDAAVPLVAPVGDAVELPAAPVPEAVLDPVPVALEEPVLEEDPSVELLVLLADVLRTGKILVKEEHVQGVNSNAYLEVLDEV